MNADRGVELPLGGPGGHRHRHALNDFTGLGADHVDANHSVSGGVHDQLHERALSPPSQGVLHRPEGGFVHLDALEALLGLRLGQAHGADVGLAKHGRGDVLVVQAARPAVAEQAVCHAHRFLDGHRRQLHPVNDVADGQDVRHGAAVFLVHQHGAVAAQGDPALRQAQALDVGAASGGEHHQVDAQHTAIG